MESIAQELRNNFYGAHKFVQTSPCGRGQVHLDGYVGCLFRIDNPDSIQVGDCFLKGRLKKGDLFLCTAHSGDCFQEYTFVREYSNGMELCKNYSFGSYGIGDSVKFTLTRKEFHLLLFGEMIPKTLD